MWFFAAIRLRKRHQQRWQQEVNRKKNHLRYARIAINFPSYHNLELIRFSFMSWRIISHAYNIYIYILFRLSFGFLLESIYHFSSIWISASCSVRSRQYSQMKTTFGTFFIRLLILLFLFGASVDGAKDEWFMCVSKFCRSKVEKANAHGT